MKCQDVQGLLHPYSDGELDLVRQLEIEKHLAACAECTEQEKHLRSLRAVLSSPSLYHSAPAGLRARIQQATPTATYRKRRSALHLAALAAGVLLLVGSAVTFGMLLPLRASSTEDRIAERVIAGHIRSLQVEHLTDVASSDRHTVKPWFRGKLDFSPQVPDLTSQGYTLFGGRLDYLVDRPVAALVYYRRLHAINVFTWPADKDEEQAGRGLSRNGYHIRYWQKSGMTYWAISDLNDEEFDEFVRLFQEHS
ncbi:MAG TPA: anti-sigma factor [Gemmata sp.]|nr:anti-sigma factor [Gemmata sp.]